MKKKQSTNFIAPILTIVISCGIGFFLFSTSNSKESVAVPAPEVIVKEAPTVQILVATNDIPVGKKLNFNDLSWRSWPESLLNPKYITQNEKPDYINSLVGGIVKTAIISGEPIIEGKIIQAGGRGAMAVLLRKGMRAVSVPISVSTAVGGFILPGDYVDIILTSQLIQQNLFDSKSSGSQEPALLKYLALKSLAENGRISDEDVEDSEPIDDNLMNIIEPKKILDKKSTKSQEKVNNKASEYAISEQKLMDTLSKEDELLITNGSNISELMLENVKVLAIDQQLDSKQPDPAQQDGVPQNNSAIVGATATLEVTPEQAKLLAWSATAGTLTLSLRSFTENLSEEDNVEMSQKIPLTKTSFAWSLKEVTNKSVSEPPKKIELIRNGNTSILYNQNTINKNTDADTTVGGTDVQR